MAQPAEDAQKSHIVINIDAEPRCCCVCTEPLDWVAFGRCRHRDVCVGCAIRIRFFQNDQRCCVCRTYCPNVVVTHVDSRLDDSPFYPRLPFAVGPGGRVGRHYWHYAGMETFFDDQNQYEMAAKACAKPPPPPDPETNVFEAETPVNHQMDDDAPSQQPAGVVVDRNRDEPLSVACLAVVSSVVISSLLQFIIIFRHYACMVYSIQ